MSFFTREEKDSVKTRFLDKQTVEHFFEHFRRKTDGRLNEPIAFGDWLGSFDLLEIAFLNIVDQRVMLGKVVELQTVFEREMISKFQDLYASKEETKSKLDDLMEAYDDLKKDYDEKSKIIDEHDKYDKWFDRFFKDRGKTDENI